MDSHTSSLSPALQEEQLLPSTAPCTAGEGCHEPENKVSPHCYNRPSSISPRGALGNNTSLKSELENIRIQDHYLDSRTDADGEIDMDNINMASLLSRMRKIRSSGQIQYRIPKKRKRESSSPSRVKARGGDDVEVDMEADVEKAESSDEHETVTIYRQKRVKKNPRGPRGVPYDKEKRHRKSHGQRRSSHSQRIPLPTPTETPEIPTTVCEEPSIPNSGSEPHQ